MKRVEFTPSEIKKIEYDYLVNGLSCKTISEKYGVSITPIKRVLRKNGKLRNGNSDGKKKNLTENQIYYYNILWLKL
jgi:transposase